VHYNVNLAEIIAILVIFSVVCIVLQLPVDSYIYIVMSSLFSILPIG